MKVGNSSLSENNWGSKLKLCKNVHEEKKHTDICHAVLILESESEKSEK